MTNSKSWKDFEKNSRSNALIDKNFEKLLEAETEHWRKVLKHLITLVQFLTTQNLAFRGTSDKLYEADNGNFLKLVEHVPEIDAVLQEHLRRITNNETQNTYLSKSIQNELIHIISARSKILDSIK